MRGRAAPALLALAVAALAAAGIAPAAHAQVDAGPYVPTPAVIVEEMLRLGAVRPGDVVMDLGSGDGRIPIEAVRRHGARAGIGVDIDAKLVRLATENAAAAGVGDRVRFLQGDLFAADLAEAGLVTVYLLPHVVTRLVPKMLAEMPAGARVVAHDYPLAPWRHDRVVSFELEEKVAISGSARTVLYLYTVPARVAGEWRVEPPRGTPGGPFELAIDQRVERTTAAATAGGRTWPIEDFAVHGEVVSFTLRGAHGAPRLLEGRVRGDRIEGHAPAPWRAERRGTGAR